MLKFTDFFDGKIEEPVEVDPHTGETLDERVSFDLVHLELFHQADRQNEDLLQLVLLFRYKNL